MMDWNASAIVDESACQFTCRGVMRMGRPWAGRSVIFWIGHTLASGNNCISNCLTNVASTIVASCSAKDDPMQVRGPAPNGN